MKMEDEDRKMDVLSSSLDYKSILSRLLAEAKLGGSDAKSADSMLKVVEEMGPHLTNSSIDVRRQAIETLASVLVHLPPDFIRTADGVASLLDFVAARFLDHHSMIPALLQALRALSQQKALAPHDALAMADTLLNNGQFQVQSLRQPERMAVMQTLTNLFAFFEISKLCDKPSLEADRDQQQQQANDKENSHGNNKAKVITSNQILFGFIQSVDGEKDPRCLLLVFDLAAVIAASFELSTLGDELFDVIACYFPIDFTPPANDPNAITAEDLRRGLRRFLASNGPAFHAQCIPLIIEKMTSSLPASRTEACDVLKECASTASYAAAYFRPHIIVLWDCLQSEMFNPMVSGASSSRCAYTECLEALVGKLYEDEATYSDLKRVAMTQLDRFVLEASLRFARQSARCVAAIARGLAACKKASDSSKKEASMWLDHYVAKYIKLLLGQKSSSSSGCCKGDKEKKDDDGCCGGHEGGSQHGGHSALNERQRRLLVLQSFELMLSAKQNVTLDAKVASELASLLLSSVNELVLCSSASTVEADVNQQSNSNDEALAAALNSLTAYGDDDGQVLANIVDRLFELVLMIPSTSKHHSRSVVHCIYQLLMKQQSSLSEQQLQALLVRVLDSAETKASQEEDDLSNIETCFDLIVTLCCSSSKLSSLYLTRICYWNDNQQSSSSVLVEKSLAALLAVFDQSTAIDCHELLRQSSSSNKFVENVLKQRLLERRLANEDVRQLLALAIPAQQFIGMFEAKQLSASDLVNILALAVANSSDEGTQYIASCTQAARTVVAEVASLQHQPSIEFCLNLSAFLVKFVLLSKDDTKLAEMLSAVGNANNVANGCLLGLTLAHAAVVAQVSCWRQVVEQTIVDQLSSDDVPLAMAAIVASTFGQLFKLGAIGTSHDKTKRAEPEKSTTTVSQRMSQHPSHLFSVRVSPLRRQALVAGLAPKLTESVKRGRHVVANLTLLTDLAKLMPSSSSSSPPSSSSSPSLITPILPAVVEQLNKLPSDRLGQVLNLLSEHLPAILAAGDGADSSAYKMVEAILICVEQVLSYAPQMDGVGEQPMKALVCSHNLQTRLAAVKLLLALASFSNAHSLLIGPLQTRIVKTLKPCLSDHKRLVRNSAANAISRWLTS